MRLLAQPLDDIRKYFGTQVALYFCWLGFYAQSLVIPAVLGLVAFLDMWRNDHDIVFLAPVFTFLVMIWSIYVTKGWRREERKIAVMWGMAGHEIMQEDRSEFRPGDSEKPMSMNYVSGEDETSFPENWWVQGVRLTNPEDRKGSRKIFGCGWTLNIQEGWVQKPHQPSQVGHSGRVILGRKARQCLSMLVVLFAVGFLVFETLLVTWARAATTVAIKNVTVEGHHVSLGWLFSVVQAGLVSIQYEWFLSISRTLNWWENYRKVVD